jgi:hypothetical protein
MTRKEYLKSCAGTKNTQINPGDIKTLDDYKALRRALDKFESGGPYTDELTPDDYAAFDNNFKHTIEQITYTNESSTKSDVDISIEMMNAINWTWAGANNNTPDNTEFIDCIRYLYERCLESGSLRASWATGGITVKTDIMDHKVEVFFGNIDVDAYDGMYN